eukprot:scaffold3064_cov221-Prasinococcus_capsulatus_cf.AAC.2
MPSLGRPMRSALRAPAPGGGHPATRAKSGADSPRVETPADAAPAAHARRGATARRGSVRAAAAASSSSSSEQRAASRRRRRRRILGRGKVREQGARCG